MPYVVCYVPQPTGASGGYLENVFRYAAKELFNVDMTERMCLVTLIAPVCFMLMCDTVFVQCGPALHYTVGKNPDFKEVVLQVRSYSKAYASCD